MVETDTLVISKEELFDSFDIHYGDMISSLYHRIKERSNNDGLGVLFNETSDTSSEFHDLIKNYVDIVDAYKKRYKHI